MKAKIKGIAPIALLTLIPTILIWLPFFVRLRAVFGIPIPEGGMASIVANYDGPLFIIVSKTFYNLDSLRIFSYFNLPLEYFAAHFPAYPVLIRAFGPFIGYPYSMLFTTMFSSFLALYFFNKYIGKYFKKADALWLTFIFSIFPARWLIVRSVGSSEPLFIAAIIASIYYFGKKKYLLAGIWGAVAQLTKSPAILLFFAYIFMAFIPKFHKLATTDMAVWLKKLKLIKLLPLLLIPLSLLGLFVFYGSRFGDFFAYFNSGDNMHLFFPPFQIFNYSASWVGTFWLEEILFIYLLFATGIAQLIKKKLYNPAIFCIIFFISIIFISHRDLLRYSLPIVPFVILGFGDYLVKKEFKYIFIFLILPIYLFSLSFISQNIMPISDWAPLL